MPRPPSKRLLERKARVAAVLPVLKRMYPAAKCSLDYRTPLQLLVKSGEYLWRRLRRQHSRAAKTRNHLRGHWAFFRSGLGD